MDTAAIAIPIPVQPVQPPQPAPGPDVPAEADGAPSGFAGALEQQIAQAAVVGPDTARAQLPATAADRDSAFALDAEERTAPDALIALMAAPLAGQTPPPTPTNARRADAAGQFIACSQGERRVLPGGAGAREQPAVEPHAVALDVAAATDVKLAAVAGDHETAALPLHPNELPAAAAPTPLQGAMTPASQPVAGQARSEGQIAARVGTAEWGDGLARQVTVMVKDGEQTAQLRLDPPELGPLEVRLSMARDQDGVAHAQFVSAHAAVRDALEAALPQLRAVLAENGITLGQASVGEGYARDDARETQQHLRGNGAGERRGDGRGDIAAPRAMVRHGLVDTFA